MQGKNSGLKLQSKLHTTNLFSSNDQFIKLAIGIVWLFHLSAVIGIYLGYEQWFVPKTPLNLAISFLLLMLVCRINKNKHVLAVVVFFMAGFGVELLGTRTGIPFGTYHYGNNLGLKVADVPLLIGINWAMLVLITGGISSRLAQNNHLRVILGASLMVLLDIIIEPSVARMDFWYWQQERIPISNYLAWFAISYILHWVFQRYIKKINFQFSLNLYLAQTIFFAAFYVYTSL